MRIELKQAAIQVALVDFLANQGFKIQGKPVTFAFTAGRGATGLIVNIDINDDADYNLSSQAQEGRGDLAIPGFTDAQASDADLVATTSQAQAVVQGDTPKSIDASPAKATRSSSKSKEDQEQNPHEVNTDPEPGTEVTTQINKDVTAKAQALQGLGHEGLENATDVVVEPIQGTTPVEGDVIVTEKKSVKNLFGS